MGAQQIAVPIYQYRIILPFDETVINVATDMDFNIEGEVKVPVTKNVVGKTSFLVNQILSLPLSSQYWWYETHWDSYQTDMIVFHFYF